MLPSGHCPFLVWKMTFVNNYMPQMCQNKEEAAIQSNNSVGTICPLTLVNSMGEKKKK